ncbi:unnamed protein product, partial [Urochloa humidicola]
HTYVSNRCHPSDRASTAKVSSSPWKVRAGAATSAARSLTPALFFSPLRTDLPTRRRKRTRDQETPKPRVDRRDEMSSPAEYYNSLPPISKAYGTFCFFTTVLVQLQILSPKFIKLYYPWVFKKFEIWRLFTNFFFLGPFSINFGIRLLMIARYGVQLEKGAFEKRTADFLWMMIFGAISLLVVSAIPLFEFSFLGIPMVSMLLYVWSREYPNSQINMYGLVQLRSFYLPWAMLALDVIFGSPLLPGLLGIMVGHLYYFLAVLHPLATGKNYLKTPKWVHSIVARFRIGVQANSPVRPPANTGTGAFRGRSYRLNQ